MSQATFDCSYTEERNRGTVAIRLILAIPHMIVLYVWNIVVEIAAIGQWFICVFTGKRNQGIWTFSAGYLAYQTRVMSYLGLLHDVWPPVGNDQGAVPTRYEIVPEPDANRLTVGLRLIWAIPAAIIGAVFGLVMYVVVIISWFAIVITGRHPRGMWDLLLKGSRYLTQLYAYVFLMTDEYPAMP